MKTGNRFQTMVLRSRGNRVINFSPQSSIRVIDSLNAKTGVIYNVSNQFTVAVPEPMTLVMLGLGLIGFGYSRRHVLSDVNGMSA